MFTDFNITGVDIGLYRGWNWWLSSDNLPITVVASILWRYKWVKYFDKRFILDYIASNRQTFFTNSHNSITNIGISPAGPISPIRGANWTGDIL